MSSFCLLLSLNSKAQISSDFYSSLDKSIKKLYQNPDDCISFTQSFLISEGNPERRIILQNILAEAYAIKGDYVQSVKTSLDNETKKIKGDDFTGFHFNYSLAEQYQNLIFFQQSGKILQRIRNYHYKSLNGSHSIITKIKLSNWMRITLFSPVNMMMR